MDSNWPPEGYQSPEPYHSSERMWMVLAFALVPPVFVFSHGFIERGIEEWVPGVLADAITTFSNIDESVVVVGFVFALFLGILLSALVVVAVHEIIHYVVSHFLGIDPVPIWTVSFGFPNPSIVPLESGVTRAENVMALAAPLVVLDLLLAVIMVSFSGIIIAVAGIMFIVNTVASCADIYNSVVVLRKPRGTVFANEIVNGEPRTEYAVTETR